jgi:predicted Zn-dependent protease
VKAIKAILVFCLFFCIFNGLQDNKKEICYTKNEYYQQSIKTFYILIDNQFSKENKLSIQKAIENWNYALNGHIVLNYTDAEEPDIIIKQVKSNNVIIPTQLTLAWVNDIGGNIIYVITDRINPDELIGTTLHELGHILGATHTTHEIEFLSNLMYPQYISGKIPCVDFDAIKKVAEFQKIPFEGFNYCF